MKKLILTSTLLVAGAFGVLAQGLVDFSNAPWEAWADGGTIDRLVYYADGVTPIDDATWSAQLVEWDGAAYQPLTAKLNFFGAGLEGIWGYDGTQVTATRSTLAVQIFDGAGAMVGQSPDFQYTKANSIPPSPADTLMVNFTAFAVPEPSTIALGVLGLGALLIFRRRK